jgi:hypothetical protein
MKLTKLDRSTFIDRAMADVPVIDFRGQGESVMRKRVMAIAPIAVQNAAVRHADYIVTSQLFSPVGYFQVRGAPDSIYSQESVIELIGKETWDEIQAFENKAREQDEMLERLEAQLRGVTNACTTLKALREALPEFVRYMPVEHEKGSNLPALANVVTDFMKAGWPKGVAPAPTPSPDPGGAA